MSERTRAKSSARVCERKTEWVELIGKEAFITREREREKTRPRKGERERERERTRPRKGERARELLWQFLNSCNITVQIPPF